MNDSDFQQLESTLGIKLPAVYVEIMRVFPAELRNWPAWAAEDSTTFLSEFDEVVDANKRIRQNPDQFVKFPKEFRTAWPKNLFVFASVGESWYLIDVNKRKPQVQVLSNGVVRPAFPDLASLYRSCQFLHGESWKKDAERSKTPPKEPKARLSFADLLEEAKYLARPAVALSAEGEEYAAVWRGTGVVPPPAGDWEHWISFDTSFIPDRQHAQRAVVSVYLCLDDGDRFHQVVATVDPAALLPLDPDGERLYAHRIACLPPIEAIFRLGRQPVQTWIKANDWNSEWPYNRNFLDSAPVEAYLKSVRAEHPFFHDEEFYAMLGGWSLWCDEDRPELRQQSLMMLTIRESEPWLEVYDDGAKLHGFSRIT